MGPAAVSKKVQTRSLRVNKPSTERTVQGATEYSRPGT